MPIINDEEFGRITVRRSPRATQVRLRVAPDGSLRASLPAYAPVFMVKRLIKTSRTELRELLQQARPKQPYTDGMSVGKSHQLRVVEAGPLSVVRSKQLIIVNLPPGTLLNDPSVGRLIRDTAIKALRIEAKSYLPKRLAYLSERYQLSYAGVRFSHAGSRWGSCSSKGTISLNIALMKLPFEIIDYVIIHELAHTRHMNHSLEFWQLVATMDPEYKLHRASLKKESPTI